MLRINQNGIGFSSTGVAGPYTQAWTLDGRLVVGGTNVSSIICYDSNGNIVHENIYHNRIPADGIRKEYREDGSLLHETTYKNSKRDGLESFKLESFKGEYIYIILPPER